jgi:hypothetical protein
VSPEVWALVIGSTIALGMFAQKALDKWARPPAPPTPPVPQTPPPPALDPRLTTLPQPPPMVVASPTYLTPAPATFRNPQESGGECMGCAAHGRDIADLRKLVERLQSETVKLGDFTLLKEEFVEERKEDRATRARIQTYFDKKAGAKEALAHLGRQHQLPRGGGDFGNGNGSDSIP